MCSMTCELKRKVPEDVSGEEGTLLCQFYIEQIEEMGEP